MEQIGLVVVIALLLAAAGAWLATHVQPDRAPPPIVVQVWSALDRAADPAPGLPELGVTPRERRRPALTRALRRMVQGVRAGGELAVVGAGAFASGFGDGLWGSFTEFMQDPVVTLSAGRGVIAALARDPLGFTAEQFDAAVDYARTLRGMPPKDAYRTFIHDLGEATADVTVARGKLLAKRAMLRARTRRIDLRRPSQPGKRVED